MLYSLIYQNNLFLSSLIYNVISLIWYIISNTVIFNYIMENLLFVVILISIAGIRVFLKFYRPLLIFYLEGIFLFKYSLFSLNRDKLKWFYFRWLSGLSFFFYSMVLILLFLHFSICFSVWEFCIFIYLFIQRFKIDLKLTLFLEFIVSKYKLNFNIGYVFKLEENLEHFLQNSIKVFIFNFFNYILKIMSYIHFYYYFLECLLSFLIFADALLLMFLKRLLKSFLNLIFRLKLKYWELIRFVRVIKIYWRFFRYCKRVINRLVRWRIEGNLLKRIIRSWKAVRWLKYHGFLAAIASEIDFFIKSWDIDNLILEWRQFFYTYYNEGKVPLFKIFITLLVIKIFILFVLCFLSILFFIQVVNSYYIALFINCLFYLGKSVIPLKFGFYDFYIHIDEMVIDFFWFSHYCIIFWFEERKKRKKAGLIYWWKHK